MKHAFFLAPAGSGAGLTTVSLGLVNALDRRGVRVAFFKPISQRTDGASGLERSTHFIRVTSTLQPADPIPVATATKMVSEGRLDELLGQLIAAFHNSTATADVVVIEGLRSAWGDPQLGSLNQELVKTLNAGVILSHPAPIKRRISSMTKSSMLPKYLAASRSFLESSSIAIQSVRTSVYRARPTASDQRVNSFVVGRYTSLASFRRAIA